MILNGIGYSIDNISISNSASLTSLELIAVDISKSKTILSPTFNFFWIIFLLNSGKIWYSESVTIGRFFCDFKKSGTDSFLDNRLIIILSEFFTDLLFSIFLKFCWEDKNLL